jgi:hypothetical protein
MEAPLSNPFALISTADVEHELLVLFGAGKNRDLVVRVQGATHSAERSDAFQELLRSLSLYSSDISDAQGLTVAPPDAQTLTRALSVLSEARLQHRLFEYILSTFGRRLVDPLAEMLDAGEGGPLLERMVGLRSELLAGIRELGLTEETRAMLESDLAKLLADEYLSMLAEHEEKMQRPRVKKLAQEVLHLVGVTFQRAFRAWPEHAAQIGQAISRNFSTKVEIGEHPLLIRRRIVEAIAEFLWVETSSDLSGALSQLFAQRDYAGLVEGHAVDLPRAVYDEFAAACWQLVADHC